jgi:hypothetical protein
MADAQYQHFRVQNLAEFQQSLSGLALDGQHVGDLMPGRKGGGMVGVQHPLPGI